MFNTALLYEIVVKQTPYDVIIGGSDLPANFDKGCVIITLINSQVLTQSYKDFSKITTQDDTHTIQSTTRVQNNYQFDLYRCNPRNLEYIDVEIQAQSLREYLKSYDVADYMQTIQAEILPTISQITFLTDFNEQKKLVNRAFFEVSIIFDVTNIQDVNIFDKIALGNTLIGG